MGWFSKDEEEEPQEKIKLICPYCEKEVRTPISDFFVDEIQLLGCEHCKKVLAGSVTF